jgi:hypothetical protein
VRTVGAIVVALMAWMVAGVVPASGSLPAATDESLDTALALLEYVPETDRPSCARSDPSTLGDGTFADAAAILRCVPSHDGVTEVLYVAYPDAATLGAAYARYSVSGLPSADGVNVVCNTEGTWSFGDGTDAGRDACFVSTEADGVSVAKMVWTADAISVLGYAINTDGDGDALKRWWNDEAGPLQEPTAVDGVASFAAADRKAAGRRLVKRLARTDARGCELRDADVSDAYSTDEAEWAWMPWVQAQVICRLPKSALYVTQVAPGDATAGYWVAFRDGLTDSGYESPSAAACSDARPHEVRGEQVGELWCWYYQQTLWASFYDYETGVVTSATIPVKPARAVAFLERHGLI